MNMAWQKTAGYAALAIAVVILLDQYRLSKLDYAKHEGNGTFFDPADIHHETFYIAFAALGVGLLL